MAEPARSADYKASTHFRLRLIKERLVQYGVAVGGIGVIIAILLIFFYLLFVVAPLAERAQVEGVASYAVGTDEPVLYLALEEQAEIGLVVDAGGTARFLSTHDGETLERIRLPIPRGVRVASFSAARPESGVVALGLSNGQALVFQHRYAASFEDDARRITPRIEYPLGPQPIEVSEDGSALKRIAVQSDETWTLVGWSEGGVLSVVRAVQQESLFEDEAGFEFERSSGFSDLEDIVALLVDPPQRNLYAVSASGRLAWFNITNLDNTRLLEQVIVSAPGIQVRDAVLLSSGVSVMIATDDGAISQWFVVRGERGARHLQKIRSFENAGALTALVPESSRKGFLTGDADGRLSIFHATANRHLVTEQVSDAPIRQLNVAPRANAFLALDAQDRLQFGRIDNEHPEVSWHSLWSKIWYEGYDEPQYVWQSSAASNDFEPKFSLVPLTFGTLKAAFYAMLFAIPLSILGAIFTAYFMAPRMRKLVKPSIEIMEALPTVILGFLAGLWLAPVVETHLPGIFALFLVMPLTILIAAWLWSRVPLPARGRIPEGWEAALLIPVVLGAGALAMWMSPLLEHWFFGGDMPRWLDNEMGIDFDQRNSIVVGIAMGFAVIPTIFSIAEDAIFSVPKHLSNGSLALGATPWQTLMRVVLLTASPGIFSGIMMGVGRAVGETMIVLMATGNTPVMDLSIFQGMRTLSANIAVEMPESEVASTHYRILFLAALVLFLFTFLFNTAAELIRQRLRRKYSSL